MIAVLVTMVLPRLIAAVHVSSGPHGIVAYVEPPHVAAGFGMIRWHLTGWFETQ